MCGFAGLLSFSPNTIPSPERLTAMTEALRPRGPDAGGMILQERFGLGHRRLKIVDTSDRSQQPLIDPVLGLTVVFNGCIYNYRELRDELRTMGYQFFSRGDTEVIAKAYHAWGKSCVKRFNGMFAFAVIERDSGKAILARDRLGIKPLYLTQNNERLAFASSLPALLKAGDVDRSLDPVALNHYMSFHAVVPPPHTIVKGIKKLPPATVAEFDAQGNRRDRTYWEAGFNPQDSDLERSPKEWQDLVRDSLRQSVKRRMVADVPVGVLLSGGVDSSLIVGLLAEEGQQDLNTFSIGFEEVAGERGDEFQYSDLIAEHYGTRHHKLFVNSKHLLNRLPEAMAAMSEPMVSYDNIAFYLLSEEVSQHIKVVQSGQGADEIFGGYHWYPPLMNSNAPLDDYAKVFFDRDYAEYCEAVHSDHHAGDASLDFVREHFDRPGADCPADKAMRLDSTVMLVDDPVKRVDNMTMAWGLEARVPFLDHEVVELAGRIPAEQKIANDGKYVLKEAARAVIPDAVIDRPKGYFPVPALKYIEGPYLDYVKEILNSDTARGRKLFKRDYVDQLLDAPKEHITPLRGSKLWQVALLEGWLQEHSL